jgi:hypothetical protein
MEGHGTTLANHGAARANGMHADHAITGKHAAGEHSASKLAGTDHHHHHHPNRRQPQYGDAVPEFIGICDWYHPHLWDCYGPTKSRAGSKQRS